MNRYSITLIKNIVNGVEVNHSKLNKIRFFELRLDHSSNHKYINLYDSINSGRWSSCIECDIISFENQNLVYHSVADNHSKMIFKIDDSEAFNMLKSLFDSNV